MTESNFVIKRKKALTVSFYYCYYLFIYLFKVKVVIHESKTGRIFGTRRKAKRSTHNGMARIQLMKTNHMDVNERDQSRESKQRCVIYTML